MSNNIDSKKYILHYKVYKNSILYFKHNYLENDIFFNDEHAIDGTVKVEKEEIFIDNNSSLSLYYDKINPQIISKSSDFTIYFRIRLKNPNENNIYHILYDGLSLSNNDDKKNGNRYSFQIKIDKQYHLILKKGLSGAVPENQIEELINVEIPSLSDGKQHYIAISRYKGKLRAYLDGKKIYDLFALTEKKNISEFFIPPTYTTDVVIGSTNTNAFYLNDLVVCNNFAFYRNLDFDVIPEDIIGPLNTYVDNTVSEIKEIYVHRYIKKIFDGDQSIKHDTKRVIVDNIFKFNTKRICYFENYKTFTKTELRCAVDFNKENNKALITNTIRIIGIRYDIFDPFIVRLKRKIRKECTYRFNTILASGVILDEKSIKIIRNIHKNYAYKFKTLIKNCISLDKLSNDNKFKTKRNIYGEIWNDDKKSKGRKFYTKRIITLIIDVLTKFNTKRKNVIDTQIEYTLRRNVLQIGTLGDGGIPSSVNSTRRNIQEDYYLLNHTSVMVELLLEKITERKVVITETKSYDTIRHVKTYSRPYVTFVYNTNINVDNPYNMSKNYISYFIYGKRAKDE